MYHRFQHIYPLENEAKRSCFEWFEWPANASNAVNDMPRYASWPFMDITILLHLRSSSWANPSHNATIFHGSSSLWNLLLSASHTSWTCWRDSQWISQERTSWSPGNVKGACPNHRATLNRSEQKSEQNTTWLQGSSRLLTRGRGVLDSLGPRGAWSLQLLHSSLHLRPGLGAEHSWGNPELQHLWKAKDLHAQRCSRGLDLMSVCPLPTDGALIMHWLCLSLQFATAVGQREEIVADSHRRTCFRFCTFEAAKTGKNQVWMVTQTSCPSVWKLRKWIRAWTEVACPWLTIGVACDLHDRYQLNMHFLCENNSSTKWEKLKCVKCVGWNHFEIFAHSVKSVSLCRKSVFGKSSAELPKTRERCDKFAGRIALQAQNPNFGHRKTIKLWIDWVDYLDNLKL